MQWNRNQEKANRKGKESVGSEKVRRCHERQRFEMGQEERNSFCRKCKSSFRHRGRDTWSDTQLAMPYRGFPPILQALSADLGSMPDLMGHA